MKLRPTIMAVAVGALTLPLLSVRPAAAQSSTVYVTPTGAAAGSCTAQDPCGNIDYAISQVASGGTVRVAHGTYHQIIVINKPLSLVGDGSSKTVVDGWGLDPYNDPTLGKNSFFGNVYIGGSGGDYSPSPIGGNVTVTGFTFENPNPDVITSGQPVLVAVQDASSHDVITITHNRLAEGASDPNKNNDYPIGIDTFKSAATLNADNNLLRGFWQGMLLEDNGSSALIHNTLADLISQTDNSTSPATTYAPEGIFYLFDLPPAQNTERAEYNVFTDYAGYGIALDAGYNNANGTFQGAVSNVTFAHNYFNLGSADGAAAIYVHVMENSTVNGLNITYNSGQVHEPTKTIVVKVDPGSTLTGLVENHNTIREVPHA